MDDVQSPVRVISGSLGIGIGVGCGVGVGMRAAASLNASMPTLPLPVAFPPQLVQRIPWLKHLRAGCGVGVRQLRGTQSTHAFKKSPQVGYGFGWGIGVPQHTLARLLPRTGRTVEAPTPHSMGSLPSSHASLVEQERDVLRERLALAEDKFASLSGLYCALKPDDVNFCHPPKSTP